MDARTTRPLKGLSAACAVLSVALLSACTTTDTSSFAAPPKVDATKQQAIAAECRLMAMAYERTKTDAERDEGSIVQGCPGFESVPVNTSSFREATRFSRAASASLPYDAIEKDKIATRVFQKMIARGSDPRVAEELTRTQEFRLAVQTARRL
ncbi:MAG: hypothetical protein AAGI12_13365 [Pseudomonadota bacterium]